MIEVIVRDSESGREVAWTGGGEVSYLEGTAEDFSTRTAALDLDALELESAWLALETPLPLRARRLGYLMAHLVALARRTE